MYGYRLGYNLVQKAALLNHIVTPDSLPNLAYWINSDEVIVEDNAVTQFIDLSNAGINATQNDASRQAIITENAINGHSKVTFDGINDFYLTVGYAIAQPYTVYLVAKELSAKSDTAFFGSKSAPFSAIPWVAGGSNFGIYCGNTYNADDSRDNEISLFPLIVSASESVYERNSIKNTDVNFGTNDIIGGIEIGRYASLDSTTENMEFYELIMYTGVHSEATKTEVVNYLHSRYNVDFGINRLDSDNYDNSVIIAEESNYISRNPFSEYSFRTDSTIINIKAISKFYEGYFPLAAQLSVYENNILKQNISVGTSLESYQVVLSSGWKNVTIVTGGNNTSTPVAGTFMTSMSGKYYKSIPSTDTSQLVFLCDSTGMGMDYGTDPQNQAYPRLFKTENNKSVAVLGGGGGKLEMFAYDSVAVTQTVSDITTLMQGKSVKKICITLGTNDYGLSSTSSAIFLGWYADLLDAINLSDSSIEIFCMSPLIRDGESSMLDDYRAGISALSDNRYYCSYIEGKTILSLSSDFGDDGLHPTVSGSKKIKDNIFPIIFQ